VPELPEVETIARELHERLTRRTIRSVEVIRPDVLRGCSPHDLAERTGQKAVLRVWRRGKTAIISLSGGEHLLVQPRFTGALLVRDAAYSDSGSISTSPVGAPEADSFATIVWTLVDGGAFWYRDVRRLGTVTLADDHALSAYSERIGPEPLDPEFDATRLSGLLRGSRSAVKKVLMDQRYLAGVGNIYANEALWRAGIDPSRPANLIAPEESARLHSALTEVLAASIQARGTTFRDYRDPSNRAGGFAAQLQAYGRGGERCPRCGTRLTETHAIDGRSTVFCHRCQR
jgi:formamidopyrimidine-DNA glycosylase